MKRIDQLLDRYGESHQNNQNKMIHWICVPLIMFSLVGLLMSIPWIVQDKTVLFNWAAVLLVPALFYYLRLSPPLFLGFLVVVMLLLYGNFTLFEALDRSNSSLALWSITIFVVAWIGQFIGHKIEGKKPSFLEDLQFLLIGPAWLLHFIYKKLGVNY